jgi:uncharacterized repeat protein (TIGR01451 family)
VPPQGNTQTPALPTQVPSTPSNPLLPTATTVNPTATHTTRQPDVHKDLEMSLAVDKEQAQVGDIVTFTIIIRNTGNTQFANVALANTLSGSGIFDQVRMQFGFIGVTNGGIEWRADRFVAQQETTIQVDVLITDLSRGGTLDFCSTLSAVDLDSISACRSVLIVSNPQIEAKSRKERPPNLLPQDSTNLPATSSIEWNLIGGRCFNFLGITVTCAAWIKFLAVLLGPGIVGFIIFFTRRRRDDDDLEDQE